MGGSAPLPTFSELEESVKSNPMNLVLANAAGGPAGNAGYVMEVGKAYAAADDAKRKGMVAPPPDVPGMDNAEIKKDVEEQRRPRAGRASTMLTGGLGVSEKANVARRTLLGA